MNPSPTQLHLEKNMTPQECKPLQQWGYPDSEGYSSLSPASSTDSYGFSPPYQPCSLSEETYSSFHRARSQTEMLKSGPKLLSAKQSHMSTRVCNQRQSASEREKMRMRSLSKALQNLRRYLPPGVAPVGKNLTKIETLRLTIRYISHLSEVLGLDEETLIKRGEAETRKCNMCPAGLSCCQDRMHGLPSQLSTQTPETLTPFNVSAARLFPEQNNHGIMDPEFHLANPQTTEFNSSFLGAEVNTLSPCTLKTPPVHEAAMPGTKEEFTAPMSPDLGFCQNFIDDMWDELQEKQLWTSFQQHELVQPHEFC
ncbi:uncharacterized protein LOC142469325 [Ascaphus truei]|uniref:uncharacterized protein LOC142469325 n=1 Tax=Ascaphus truei TaxID=8439 RepID=UPI003F59DA7F